MSIDNGEVKYYQPRFAKWIQSAKWDSIAERLSETSMSLITQVMNAEKDGDCSWIAVSYTHLTLPTKLEV